MSDTISIEWTFSSRDEETEAIVLCGLSPADASVGAGPEVEIIEVREAPGGQLRPDLLSAAEFMVDLIAEAALEAAMDREEAAREAADDARYEAARDERHWQHGH